MPLAQEVKAAASKCLLDLLPVWMSMQPEDHRRIQRPVGPGNYSIAIEPYRGTRTWIGFLKHMEASDSLSQLKAAISEYQPELKSFLVMPGRAMSLDDCSALISTWCKVLEFELEGSRPIELAINTLLENFSGLLETRVLKQRVSVAIAGLQLPTPSYQLVLSKETTLRALSVEELTELSSKDITFGHDHDIMSHSVSSCLVFETEAAFTLEQNAPETILTSSAEQEAAEYAANLLRALHVLKPGRAGVFLTSTTYSPKLFPRLDGGSSWPLYRPPFSSLAVEEGEVDKLVQILRALQMGPRDELRIASDRLVDAESRMSPVDSLLDAVIGLEALLNPMDSSELAFRVAMNYAFLASPEYRRDRYDRVRVIQKTRNRVVHGGLNSKSPDATLIQEHAGLAKATLRDTIQCFLLDPSLAGNRKLDADFWLERILPANVLAANSSPLVKN